MGNLVEWMSAFRTRWRKTLDHSKRVIIVGDKQSRGKFFSDDNQKNVKIQPDAYEIAGKRTRRSIFYCLQCCTHEHNLNSTKQWRNLRPIRSSLSMASQFFAETHPVERTRIEKKYPWISSTKPKGRRHGRHESSRRLLQLQPNTHVQKKTN